jgi:hypothetical protein
MDGMSEIQVRIATQNGCMNGEYGGVQEELSRRLLIKIAGSPQLWKRPIDLEGMRKF